MTKRILVVDDAPATLRLLQVALGREGYEVVTVDDGEAGLASVDDRIPDLIILDIALPDMDGWEVLARLRENPNTEQIPVIIMSAHDSDAIRGRTDLSAASAFIGKPFAPELLRKQVRRILDAES